MIRFVGVVLKGKYYLPIHKRQDSGLIKFKCENLLKEKSPFKTGPDSTKQN